MATTNENPEKYAWWVNELNSLGVKIDPNSKVLDAQQLENLADDIKQKHIHKYTFSYNKE